MSRPAYRRSVIRSDNRPAGLVIYHLEAFIIEHIEKCIIFSCSNEGEYSGYHPAHTCHVTGVRYSNTDSAVPYTVTVYSAYIIRSTARISFTVGNPGNLGCVLCRTETAVKPTVPHTVDCLADFLLWLSGLTATAIHRFRSQATVFLWTVSLPCRKTHNLVGNNSWDFCFLLWIPPAQIKIYFDSVTSDVLAGEQKQLSRSSLTIK